MWSHVHCQKAYTFFSVSYGLARLITMGVLEFTTGTRTERQQFARALARQFVRGLELPAAPAP